MYKKNEIFISAGDFSGDMHAAFLVKNFRKYCDDSVVFSGIGGTFLEKENINFLSNIVNQQGFGFGFGIIKKYFYFKNILFNLIEPYLKKNIENIKMVILIDFYGFNIYLAEVAKKLGIKVVYYICPQIWASRKNRIKKIKKFVDIIIPILPFEKEIYELEKIETHYFGNPLIDIINESIEKEKKFDDFDNIDFNDNKKFIGLMPGSRVTEVKNILPIFLESITRLLNLSRLDLDLKNILKNYEFVLILSENIYDQIYKKNDKFENKFDNSINKILHIKIFEKLKIIKGPAYNLRKKMSFILTSSGTSSLENCILKTPMMIFYKLDFLSYNIAKLIIKVKFIGLPNILANKSIMPEYIQNFSFTSIANEMKIWIKKENFLEQKKEELKKVNDLLFLENEKVIEKIVKFIANLK